MATRDSARLAIAVCPQGPALDPIEFGFGIREDDWNTLEPDSLATIFRRNEGRVIALLWLLDEMTTLMMSSQTLKPWA